MSFERIRQRFAQFPFGMKLIGAGSLFLMISTILPWYSDLDQYKVGDSFLGITGPASFVGIVIFLLSGSAFGLFLAQLLERKRPKLPVKESMYQMFVGLESLFLLVVVASIYFHPKFGVNITLKDPRFGLIAAFLASMVLSYGGYYQYKKDQVLEDSIGKLEPLVTLPQKRTSAPEQEDVLQIAHKSTEMSSRLSPLKERLPRNFSFGEVGAARGHTALQQHRKVEYHDTIRETVSSSTEKTLGKEAHAPSEETQGSYKIRMDL